MPIGIDPAQRRNLGLAPDPHAPPVTGGGTLELLREKVRASVVAGRVQFLPWLDRYTRETPQMRRFYRQLLKVPVVKAALYGKVFAAASLDLQLHPEQDTDRDNRIADATRDGILACKGGLRKIAETTLAPALIDGHSVAEKGVDLIERGRWKGLYGYKHLKGKDTDEGPAVKLITDEYLNVVGVRAYGYGQTQVHDPKDFVILSYMSLFESPAGISDMRAVYAPFWRLDTAEKLRAIHLEKYTSPLLKGTYSDPADKPALDVALAQAAGGTWFSVPEGVIIEAMQIATRGEAEFQAACADYKEDIALAIAGAFLQMLTSRGGGGDMRGDAATQKGTAELFVWYLATLLAELITDQMVPDLVDLNWAGAGYPKATLGGVNDAELLKSAQLDQLLQQLGLPLSRKERARYYGRQLATDSADELKPVQAGPATGAGGGLPFSAPREGKQGLPFAEGQGGEEIALPGREGARAGELLREAQAHGQRVLLDVLRPAVERLVDAGGAGYTLFAPGERQQLAEALAGTLAAADLLGRARLRELVRRDGHFAEDAAGHEHKGKGKGGGQFVKQGGGGSGEGAKPKGKAKGKTPDKTEGEKANKVGETVSPREHAAALAKARQKFEKVPQPTAEEVAAAKAGIAKLGANKYRRNLVGNTKDRAKRREALLQEFGDGKTCPCIYCGLSVTHGTLEQDKIITTAQGGRYRTPNLVPSCGDCNKRRGDMPFAAAIKKVTKHA